MYFEVALVVKNLPASAGDIGDAVSIPGWGRSLGRGHDTSLQYFAWRTPWTEEPGRLWFIASQRVGYD